MCTDTLKLRCAIEKQVILSNLYLKLIDSNVIFVINVFWTRKTQDVNFTLLSGECKCEDTWSGCIMGDTG